MTPTDLIPTIYLGDRACRGIFIDSLHRRVSIWVDCISRVRSEDGAWHYYTKEDIEDGRLVFVEAKVIRFDPAGPIPNDFINDLQVEPIHSGSQPPVFRFRLSISHVDVQGKSTEVVVQIEAASLGLEDPKRPGVLIVD